MLSALYRQRYGELKQVLDQVSRIAAQSDCDGSALKSSVAQLQKFFQNQILSLQADELSPETEQRVQSYLVEINKQLRLLEMDVMFLQAARQPATREQRQRQMGDRLMTLIRYCEAVLG